jgi:Protein of unknown function (DUF2934)
MANKTVRSFGSKAAKGQPNTILSTASSGKVGPKPHPEPKTLSELHGATASASAEERRVMIAEAAYYLAEHRGFEGGREMEDWLLAEQQVDAVLSGEASLSTDM